MNINFVKVEIYIPDQHVKKMHEALNEIGVLKIGDYDYCMAITPVKGYFRPLSGSNSFIGEVGEVEEVDEIKMEFRCPYKSLQQVIKVIKSIHPYEEPVFHILPIIL